MSSPGSAPDCPRLLATPLHDLGLTIPGSRLEPLIVAFEKERMAAGMMRLQPQYYLSTEWGVPFGTISVGIPFCLARADLIALHVQQVGFLEGAGRNDFLRYLRHEVGHVVNYAYRLYDRSDWTKCYGSIKDDYVDEYRLQPFSPEYVCNLPGWYAQKHPDEDWAECFAVWMTPDYDWRAAYSEWPVALAKLEFCDRLMKEEVNQRDPDVTVVDMDEEVGQLSCTLQHFYDNYELGAGEEDASKDATADIDLIFAPALNASLHGIFEDFGDREDLSTAAPRLAAGALIRRIEQELVANVYRWTGCFPERVRALVQQLAERSDQLHQVYPSDHETAAVTAVTALVTALALDRVVRRGVRQSTSSPALPTAPSSR